MGKENITNQTMNLADCKESWTFNEEYQCWCLEDIVYTPNSKVPHCQKMNIFVPKIYMKESGEIDLGETKNGYNAKTAPVVFENNSAGYMEMINVGLGQERCYAKSYLDQGYVYISCGNRGSMSTDQEESDAVFAAQIYCPIIDLEHADFAYEWMFATDHVSEWTGEFTPFQKALSKKLQERYITYFNSLKIKNPEDGSLLIIGKDGRSGSGYEYLMKKLGESATIYLKKLEAGEVDEADSVQEYVDRLKWLSWDGKEAKGDQELEKRKYLINPFNFIGTEEKTNLAEHYRIRVGAKDPDTSFTISMSLACRLAEAGKPVDYQLVWNQPHCEADYPGEIIDWIENLM